MTESVTWLIVNIVCFVLIIFNFIYFIKGKTTLIGLLSFLVGVIFFFISFYKMQPLLALEAKE